MYDFYNVRLLPCTTFTIVLPCSYDFYHVLPCTTFTMFYHVATTFTMFYHVRILPCFTMYDYYHVLPCTTFTMFYHVATTFTMFYHVRLLPCFTMYDYYHVLPCTTFTMFYHVRLFTIVRVCCFDSVCGASIQLVRFFFSLMHGVERRRRPCRIASRRISVRWALGPIFRLGLIQGLYSDRFNYSRGRIKTVIGLT